MSGTSDELKSRLEKAEALLALATCFRIGRFYVEHLVDTENRDYGWIVKENGAWENFEKLTRDQAIAQAEEREVKGK